MFPPQHRLRLECPAFKHPLPRPAETTTREFVDNEMSFPHWRREITTIAAARVNA
jgi:hypothetical protein